MYYLKIIVTNIHYGWRMQECATNKTWMFSFSLNDKKSHSSRDFLLGILGTITLPMFVFEEAENSAGTLCGLSSYHKMWMESFKCGSRRIITSNGWKMRAVNTFLAGWRDRGRAWGRQSGDCHDLWKTENIQTDTQPGYSPRTHSSAVWLTKTVSIYME